MDSELKAHLEAMESRMTAAAEAAELRMKEHVESIETKLLSAFWQWGKTSEIKMRQHGEGISFIDERLTVVEERLAALEFRPKNEIGVFSRSLGK
jgi:hypothetical protein